MVPRLHKRLRRLASERHRSLSTEVIDLLEAAVVSRDRQAAPRRALNALDEIARRVGPVPEGTRPI